MQVKNLCVVIFAPKKKCPKKRWTVMISRKKPKIFLFNFYFIFIFSNFLLLQICVHAFDFGFTTRIPNFSNWIFKPKIPQSDKGSKNHFGFLGQVDFNKSSMTRMVFFTNLRVVLLTNPKAMLLIKSFD